MRFFSLISVLFFFSSCAVVHSDGSITSLSTPSGAVRIRDAQTRATIAPATVEFSHHALEHPENGPPAYSVSENGVSYGHPGGGYYGYYSGGTGATTQDLAVIEAADQAAWEAGVEETLRRQDEEIKRNGRKVDKTTKGMLKHIRGK